MVGVGGSCKRTAFLPAARPVRRGSRRASGEAGASGALGPRRVQPLHRIATLRQQPDDFGGVGRAMRFHREIDTGALGGNVEMRAVVKYLQNVPSGAADCLGDVAENAGAVTD